ncbi:serine hydrolase [Patescibacteria group bacterium]|nr:serine hydrolase [Patescibacteria group bacterium]
MLLSILANLIGIYSLLSLPLASSFTIDVSQLAETGNIELIEEVYRADYPYRRNNNSLGMAVSAASAIVIDKESGMALWQKNPESARPVASITKLLTALVFLDNNPGWDEVVTIQPSDYREGGQIRVYTGEKITIRDLFNAMLVVSSNNAAMALVRSTGLSEEEFVIAMNQKARELGMSQSVFLEPTGLEPGNISTISDIVKLAQAAFSKDEIKWATSQKQYTYSVLNVDRNYTLDNTNKLLNSYLDIRAGKTGYLEEAGYCLISEVKGPSEQSVIVAVLGSQSEADRFQDLKALSQWSFDNYIWEH